jgi:hypothetical protein
LVTNVQPEPKTCQIFVNEIPLGDVNYVDFIELIAQRDVRPDQPDAEDAPYLSDPIWELAGKCWVKDPKQRPTASVVSNILSHLLDANPRSSQFINPGQLAPRSFSWLETHKAFDTSKHYYIKNRATGRFWSFIDNQAGEGYVVCGRTLQAGQTYFHVRCLLFVCVHLRGLTLHQWILIRNPEDQGMTIETPHYNRGIKVMERMEARYQGGGSFHFIPVSGKTHWYL